MSLHTIKYDYPGACLAHNEIVSISSKPLMCFQNLQSCLAKRNETELIQSFNEGMYGILVE